MSVSFVYHHFESITEFLNHRTGDCGPTALLSLLHVIDDKRWPLSAAGLDALCKDIDKHHDLMNKNGEMNIPGLDNYLTAIKVKHTTVGYKEFKLDGLHQALKNLAVPAKRQLVLVEWSDAGNGLHDDERGVKFHFSGFGGIVVVDGQISRSGYLRSDGDSSHDKRDGTPVPPILTGWPSIEAAKPIAYITLTVPPLTPPPPPPPIIPPEIAAEVASAAHAILHMVNAS